MAGGAFRLVNNHDKSMARSAGDARDAATVWTNARRGAFGQLSAALLARRQVVALVSDVGMGKATMLREWRRQCGHSTRVFWMAGVTGDADADGASLASAFSLDAGPDVPSRVEALLKEDEDDRFSNVLVVEDAHLLDGRLLDDLAALTRMDNAGLPLLQLILSGDATLYDTLEDEGSFPDAELVDLPSLTQTSTATLFKRRIGDLAVEPAVLGSVFDLTGGVPGQIVALADAVVATKGDADEELSEAAFAAIVDQIDSAPPEPAPRELPPEVNDPSKLPGSISKSDDPRNMLRWAFGLNEDEDDGSTQEGALHLPPSRPGAGAPAAETVTDLNKALAEIAARETAGTAPAGPAPEPMPQLPFSGNVDPSQFRHGAEGLAGIVNHDRRLKPVSQEALAAGPPMSAPDDLKEKVLTEEPVKRGGVGRVLLMGTGLAACFAAGAYVWPLVQDQVLPRDGAAVPQTNAAVVAPVLEAGPAGIFSSPVAVFSPDQTIALNDIDLAPGAGFDAARSAGVGDASPRIASANPFQVEEQSRTALQISNDAQRQALMRETSAAAARLDAVEAEIAKAEQRLAALTSQEDLILNDITTLRNEQVALTQEADGTRTELALLKTERRTQQQGLDALEADQVALRGAIAQSEARLNNLSSALAVRSSELETRASAAADAELLRSDTLAALESLQAQKLDLETAVADLEAEHAAIRDTVAQGQAEVAALQDSIAVQEAELADRQATLADLTNDLDAARADVAAVQQATAQAQAARDAAAAEQEQLAAQLAETAGQRDAAEVLRLALTEDIAAARASLQEVTAQRDAATAAVAEADAALAERLAATDAATADVADAQAAVAALKDTQAALKDAIAQEQAALETAQAEVARVQEIIASAEADRDASVAALNVAKLSETEALARVDAAQAKADAQEARLADALAARDAAAADLDKLSASLNADTARRSEALTTIATSQATLRDLVAQVDAAKAALADLDAQKQASEATVASVTADLDRVTAEFNAFQADRDRLAETVAAEQARLEQIKAEQASSDAALAAKLAALTQAQTELDTVLAKVKAAAPQPLPAVTAALKARSPAIVDAALLRSPGLDALSDEQANALRDALVQGHCVADALKAATGRANPFTVRALKRTVGPCNG